MAVLFLGATSGCTLYLLRRYTVQKDATSIRARLFTDLEILLQNRKKSEIF